eukprot:334043-Hanusia_phi.AAC.1
MKTGERGGGRRSQQGVNVEGSNSHRKSHCKASDLRGKEEQRKMREASGGEKIGGRGGRRKSRGRGGRKRDEEEESGGMRRSRTIR